ncbi:unnamed protein product, partial [Discosporangium mesarthrocarpum]
MTETSTFASLRESTGPVVLRGAVAGWPGMDFLKDLGDAAELVTTWRVHPHGSSSVWESECIFLEASLGHFVAWEREDVLDEGNPFAPFNRGGHWVYADYKRLEEFTEDKLNLLGPLVDWGVLGCSKRLEDSTFWLGSEGSHTPLHHDTYGLNLVAQLHGRKKWTLFPPEDTEHLYPTRIPYEESSVFSQVDVRAPDLKRQVMNFSTLYPLTVFPKFGKAKPVVINLVPGDALYVPKHWWHFVETQETSLSVNIWVDHPGDAEDRATESLARVLATSLARELMDEVGPGWLNPTEEGIWSMQETMEVAGLALKGMGVSEEDEGGNKKDNHNPKALEERRAPLSVHALVDCFASPKVLKMVLEEARQ